MVMSIRPQPLVRPSIDPWQTIVQSACAAAKAIPGAWACQRPPAPSLLLVEFDVPPATMGAFEAAVVVACQSADLPAPRVHILPGGTFHQWRHARRRRRAADATELHAGEADELLEQAREGFREVALA